MINAKNRRIFLFLTLWLTLCLLLPPAKIASAASSSYWLKVNTEENVVTAYKKINGEWEPYRAMLCSTGVDDNTLRTPTGSFSLKRRWDWGVMYGNVYARYCVQFHNDYLFHSVPYYTRYKNASQPTSYFNKLGSDASHGCVRLSTMDAKWIYENCEYGTPVTIYKSSDPGPLGKPPATKTSPSRTCYWDPTNPVSSNPNYMLPGPVIGYPKSKLRVVEKGESYSLKSKVYAMDPNTYQDLTDKITVSKVMWYSKKTGDYIEKEFSTSRTGTYRVTYKVSDKYCGTDYKTIKIRVAVFLKAPKVSADNAADTGYPVITWSSVPHAKEYAVFRAVSAKGTYKKIGTASDTRFLDKKNVVPGKKYYYKVKALAGNDSYADSAFSKSRVRACALPRPVVTASKNKKTGNISLSWKKVKGADAYKVYRATKKNGTYKWMSTVTDTSYTNSKNVKPGVRYYYKVKAICKDSAYGNSAYSIRVSAVKGVRKQ